MTSFAQPSPVPDDGSSTIFSQVSGRVSAAAAALVTQDGDIRPVQTRALWRVFHDFAASYRRERRDAGLSPVPSERDAAVAFRRDPTLTTLVAVASVLGENGFSTRPL